MRRMPGLRSVVRRMEYLEYHERFCPLGHYYSPIASVEELRGREEKVFDQSPESLPGIELNDEGQRTLLSRLGRYYHDWPFPNGRASGLRYSPQNEFFGAADGLVLYGMLRDLRPRRMIEVGSGYSSALTLDVNDLFFGGAIACTFIDPHPQRLLSMLKPNELVRTRIVGQRVQELGPELFDQLGENDVLFIDSSHVSKVDSDVNYLVLEILPRLARGVWVHIHDICYPFEYRREWVYGGRSWNEAYLVRAFLQFNQAYGIACFVSYLQQRMTAALEEAMPLATSVVGQSLWLQRRE